MQLSDYSFDLPESLIAQHPAERRDASRLLMLDRKTGRISHHSFQELPALLASGDLLVLNDTRVFPARLIGSKPTGGRIEVLLLRQREEQLWECLVRPARRCPAGTRLIFQAGVLEAEIADAGDPSRRLIHFLGPSSLWDVVDQLGRMPLPPYIRRDSGALDPLDRERYQTVFARVPGSVAAPTAGLHFTPELLAALDYRLITLHVGYGTFQPIHSEEVENHRMEREAFHVSEETARAIRDRRATGGRVVAVGTTTARTLESVALQSGEVTPGHGETDLYIYPGFQFQVADGLVTNFHLPRSTLLLLVCAFAGREPVLAAYQEAIREGYRFYSYGDAMLIL